MYWTLQFLNLPVELICHILSFLNNTDLIRCTVVAKQLRKVILDSSRLQYTIELAKHRMVSLLPPSSAPPYVTRLKRLRDREHAWKTLTWNGRYNLKLPPTGSVYEFVGGLYGNGREDDRRVTASISFLELPSGDPVYRESGLKIWTHSMSDVTIIDFTMDPSQDLLVLIALATPSSKYVYDLHLRSLSTNEPHPKAQLSVLSCLWKTSHTNQASDHVAAVRVQVSGDLVALLVKEVHDSVGAHLEIWDWMNNPQVSCTMTRASGIDDFTFLSKEAFLVVRPTGNFEVYTFRNPIIEGLPPFCQASYGFPPLSDGFMYWYITMSSNPAPGSIPRPQPGADMPGKQIYYPKPDERIHACCLYIFNPASEDQDHRVHCFVFFVNIHTLLHPPAEWYEKTRARYNSGRMRTRKYNSPSNTDNSDTAFQNVSLASAATSSPALFPSTPYIVPGVFVTIAPPVSVASPSQNTTTAPLIPPHTLHAVSVSFPQPGSGIHAPLQIPWSVWGPQSTRWFQECLTTDWQHSIYGLRTIESVTLEEIGRTHPRLHMAPPSPLSPLANAVDTVLLKTPLSSTGNEAGASSAGIDASVASPVAAEINIEIGVASTSSTSNDDLTPPSPAITSTASSAAGLTGGGSGTQANDEGEPSTSWRHLRFRDYNPYSIMERLQEEGRLQGGGDGDGVSMESSGNDKKGKGKGKVSWRTPRVITEPTVTNVRGVFREDVTSWLPYMEVVSEEIFEVTDVMMDDSRLLLLKVVESLSMALDLHISRLYNLLETRTMLSRFLSSFSFSLYNDEKSYVVMPTTKVIPGAIPKYRDNRVAVNEWIEVVVESETRICDRLDDLRGVHLRSVSHYRGKGSTPHELIVIGIKSGDDERFMRLERFNKKEDVETISGSKKRATREIVGLHTGNSDIVKWFSTLDTAVTSSYKPVQTLTFPLDYTTLSIIDVIALATTITSSAQNYSLFAHMCMWWAAMFFECLKKKTTDHNGVRFVEGPLYAERGNIFKCTFVDANCKLLAHGLTVKAKSTLRDGANQYSVAEIEEFQMAIDNDSQLADGDLAGNPVETMVKRWETSGKELTASLQAAVDAAIAERDALKIAKAQVAELGAALAAERAERIKLEAKLEQQMADLMARVK
ncbi:hypothetical protein D9615_006966 [Tricholomella constricta]|uniref:F-box domain-containing protein n=1 Tax=Tricholomella constricta TaxID=117010 RepID=A0A8H5H907_9AGAR|nr:hypothetical protein D9615_006966 [Tricholomella constricta]